MAAIAVSSKESEDAYGDFIRRRRARGELSIRTLEGFRRLQKRYGQLVTKGALSDPVVTSSNETSKETEGAAAELRNVVDVLFNPKISRVITETCWCLAHFCGGDDRKDQKECASLILDAEKYSTFNFRLLQWVFPELPRKEAQQLVQRDWEHDLEFDERQGDGLSLHGFKLSLVDLVVSCTAKVCSAPLAIMVLAADENPIELLLSTNSKLLITKTGNRVGAYRKVTAANVLCGELKRQGCWTFCMNPSTPLILMVPNESVSRQTKAIYAYFRAFSTDKQQEPNLEVDNNRSPPPQITTTASAVASTVTLFTSTPQHCSLRFGSKSNVPYRMERMSARMFTVDHSVMKGGSFSILVTASLLQCTSAAGGPGAAAAVSSTFEEASIFTIRDDQWTGSQRDGRHNDAHTFIFIFKSTEPVVPGNTGLKEHEATLPQQWFTSLSAANETKTIVIERSLVAYSRNDDNKNDETSDEEARKREVYHLFIFTLHGIYIEVSCAAAPVQNKESECWDGDSRDSEDSDTDDHNVRSLITQTPLTSAELLKELLLLEKMRRNLSTSEDLPDILIGTQVTTTKPVTIAESLRTKVLRSRQDERHDRFEQLEAAIRKKLVECKPRRPNSTTTQAPDISDEKVEIPSSPTSNLEKRVNLLTTFFHEMAVHQPKLDEFHASAAETAEAAAEELLLKRFGEIFNGDEDLQNTLDEEKWSTDTAKVERRRNSISTNLPKAMQAEAISGTRDQIDEGKYPWTFEDYENTAKYIEQLMVDIETHATQQQDIQDAAEAERRQAVMTQLVASWQYTQHRVNKAATRQRVREIEQKRRSQWLQSQHVQVCGAVASAKRGDRPERPAFILPKQRFVVQEESLPSTAVWEVPSSPSNQANSLVSGAIAAAGVVSSARPMSPRTNDGDQSPSKIRPRRPPQRPMTVATAERPSNITALRSAALSRARVRRIRSAHCSSSRGNSAAQSPKNTDQPELQGQSLVSESQVFPTNSPEVSNCLDEGNTQLRAIPSIPTLPDVNADHCVVDAEGLTLLMKRWSHHYDDVATSTSAHLSHDRRQLIPSRPNSSTKPHPEYACACHASTQSQMHVDPVASSSSGFATSQQRFHLSPRELRDLKTFAAFGDETPPFSTLDCVTALLTWLITRCRGHRDAVQVSTALNLRRRMQPPLPDHFTGNAVLPALSRHPAQDFEASNSSPCARSLHAIARRIRESVTKFTDAYIRDTILLLAAHTVDPDALQSAARFASGPDLLFSSWRGLGMTDVDFGSRPTYVGPPALQPCDGVVIFLDQVDSQPGLDALVFLEDKTMHKLLGLWQLDVFVHTGTPPRAESRTI
ncbi:hypothetical protein PF008_g19183 [Phytophthora fragariae]|uniref:Uncharacterized protein n=1 Tax=Phytophthora fragariae TaxID=53985 RepID=A0A6G0R486_9STRA|nr:hypothetical protein PF008_g19183 [Phytophthora fragariae]